MSTKVKNRVQALLDKYELRSEFSDLFGKRGMEWLSSLKLDAVDQAILESDLKLLKSLEEQAEFITSKIASLAKESDEVKLLMTLPRIDFYSAMLIIAEIGDVKRFPEARKLLGRSCAQHAPVCKHDLRGQDNEEGIKVA